MLKQTNRQGYNETYIPEVITVVLINVIRTLLHSSRCILKNISSQVEIFSTSEKANIYEKTYQKKLETRGAFTRTCTDITVIAGNEAQTKYSQKNIAKKGEQIFFSSIRVFFFSFFFVRTDLEIDQILSLKKM